MNQWFMKIFYISEDVLDYQAHDVIMLKYILISIKVRVRV